MPITVPEIITDRLTLRSYREADIPDMVHYLGDWETVQYTTSIPHPYSKQDAASYIEASRYLSQDGFGVFAIERQEDRQWMGAISLDIRDRHPEWGPELGYVLGRPFWRYGYATEAARAILDYGFSQLKIKSIMATTYLENIMSERVLMKLGFRYHGDMEIDVPARGGRRHLKEYRLTTEEWDKRSHA